MIENIAIKMIGFLNKKQREYTEYKLVQQAQNGCDESFEKLINSYKEYLYKTAFLYVKNEHDALDIYQETVYKAYINIQKLRNTKLFKTWIIKILINNVNMKNRHYNKFQDEPVEDYIGEIEYSNIEENIDLYDEIEVEKQECGIILECNKSYVPVDNRNLAYKAAEIFKERYDIVDGVKINIEKNIPVAAGMAGGSSNAAAVLVGLNKLWKLNLSEVRLQEIGLKLGADVPFCISGNAALAQGIGEELTYIKGLSKDTVILVCKPNLFVSTKEVYEGLDLQNIKNRQDNKFLIEWIEKENIDLLATNMVNVLETVTSKMHEEIKDIEKVMLENNALGSMMSGSGPTVFGLFDKEEDALSTKGELLKKYNQVYVVRSSEKGVEVNGEFN